MRVPSSLLTHLPYSRSEGTRWARCGVRLFLCSLRPTTNSYSDLLLTFPPAALPAPLSGCYNGLQL